MNTRIITIGRQFGSNGHLIAHELAKRLGIKCYDKSLISFAAEHTGIPYSQLEIVDEKKENKWRYLVDVEENLDKQYRYEHIDEILFQQQSKIIRELAEEGDCIFVGRCADYVLRDKKQCKHIYLYAPEDSRIHTIMNRYGMNEKAAANLMKKVDKDRRYYYNYHTDQKWEAFQNYDLTLNTASFSLEEILDILEHVFQQL